MRNLVLEEGRRADGRGLSDVRSITSRCGLLPRAHGSALFTRGETQALAVTTLGRAFSHMREAPFANSITIAGSAGILGRVIHFVEGEDPKLCLMSGHDLPSCEMAI